MKCPKCQNEVPEGSNFCNKCGQTLFEPKQPSSIDFTQPQSYTPKFLADKILTSRSAMEGERKRVTVLFADVAGFTSMSEILDPEEVHQIMDGCFKILMDTIHNHQGTINQFTGDGVMALFGAPVAIENHAQNACQAALAIQSVIKGYSEELKIKFRIDFKMRIGLNSGPVIVGSIGDDLRMDYTAIGDTTNLAARMESMTEPGTILVSDFTYKRVGQQFDFKPLGEADVKGKKEPLEVYVLIKAKSDRPYSGLERQIFSEMVGREEDLNALELQVMKAIKGEGSIVNVIGEAGIGKSRLIAELRNSSVMKRVTLLEGRAISIGRNLSFHPIINLLKHWAQIKEKDTSVSALGKLETAIRSICPEDTNEIFPFVATLMGMKLSGRHLDRVNGIEGEALEKLISKNMRDLLIKSTELTPLVVVIEDLHWADTSSIEFLEFLFRLAETQRILFINVFRPNHPETSDRIIETIKEKRPVYYVEINLQPLNEQMGEMLINNMLNIRGLQHAVVDQIIQRAGGNPFFIEEVVRSFIDEGAVVKANGEFKVTEKIEKMVIPYTINDVIMARIDRLDENTRDLVKVASVIGRSFFYRILTEVANTVDGIGNRLSYLKQIELIREQQRMEELEYLFKHALAQEAAYESILHQKRKDIHLQVAQSIEKVFDERLHEFYGMLALHYIKGENNEKAEEYLIKAGEEALRSSASNEALKYYQKGLKLYLQANQDFADPEKLAMFEKNIALAFFNKGQYVEAVEYFDKTISSYGVNIPKHPITSALKCSTSIFAFLIAFYLPFLKWKKNPTKKDKEIISLFYKKVQALSQNDSTQFFIQSIYLVKRLSNFDMTKIENGAGIMASISLLFSYPGISFSLSRKVLEYVKDKIDIKDNRSVLYYLASELMFDCTSGNWPEEIEFDDDLIYWNLGIGDFLLTTVYIEWKAYLYIARANLKDAQRAVQKIYDIGEIYNNELAKVVKFVCNTHLLLKFRKIQDTFIEVNKGIKLTIKTGFKVWLINLYSIKARIQIMLGDTDGAEDYIDRAEKITSNMEVVPQNLGEFALSKFYLAQYFLEESLTKSDKVASSTRKIISLRTGKYALKIASKIAIIRTETWKLMGSYFWLIGKQKMSIKWWRKAIQDGQDLNNRLELSRSYFEVGKRLLEPKSKYKELNGITAEEYLEKARTMFEEMDLQWDLDELDKVMVSSVGSP